MPYLPNYTEFKNDLINGGMPFITGYALRESQISEIKEILEERKRKYIEAIDEYFINWIATRLLKEEHVIRKER